MQDKTITNALLALRKQIIRGNLDGLHHVEALLTARNVDMPRVLPAKRQDAARRGYMSMLVLEALGSAPLPLQSIAEHVAQHRPELDRRAAYIRTTQALTKLKKRGMVKLEGRLWWVSRL